MILVSILGDFHSSIFPIYNEFKDKISTHILVHDHALGEKMKHKPVLESLEKFNKKHSLKINTQEHIVDEDSLASITNLVEKLKTISNEWSEVYINSTDGLSNIGIILAHKTLDYGVNIISYDMHENSYNITTKESMHNFKINSHLKIKDHLLLKGLEIVSLEDKEFAHKNEAHIRALFDNYRHEFNNMKKDIYHRTIKQHNYPRAYQIIQNLGLDFQNSKEITGGLFEFYVYLLIKDLGFDDIEIGVKINQYFSQNSSIPNEFDVLAMKDNHLHIIECKFSKNNNLNELVYKYSSLINLLDDEGKMIILTDKSEYSHDLYENNTTNLEVHKRAKINRILVRGSVFGNKAEFVDDVKTFFNLHS
ncbi:MAG: hypothetical protein QG565_867 [Campylobacterota bacterium]|nr:hypothetical protein [Campylobacterota bacterium]